MEQVLAPRFEFKPKNPATSTATPGFDYGEGGYKADQCNVGFLVGTKNVDVHRIVFFVKRCLFLFA